MTTPNKLNISTLSDAERIKDSSNYLRGSLAESLTDEHTGAFRADDQIVIKFHGSYQQADRDLEIERKNSKLEPLYSFMIRVRVPGGVATSGQWLAMDKLSSEYANQTLKLTTRQAFQFHGVLKRNLKKTIQEINQTLLDTLAACGDVNRNIMLAANPWQSALHAEVHEHTRLLHSGLSPKTGAYHEIWLDGKKVAGNSEAEEEPLYGKLYLPRKFKMAIAIPPDNDVDIFANDLGLIAISENGKLAGYNLCVGGGMGMTFGIETTYPRLSDVVGYFDKQKVLEVATEVLSIQRDWGNRQDRKQSRFKYTIDRTGLDTFTKELETRLGWKLEPARKYEFTATGDQFGWKKGVDNNWHFTLFVEGGRVKDDEGKNLRTALREIAEIHQGVFILTGNQNLVIAQVEPKNKAGIEKILAKYQLLGQANATALRLNSIACASMPLCPLAFAEAERYLPKLIDKLDDLIRENHLEKDPIIIRMTGCPNGCGRPFLGEIGLVGKAPGKYNLYLGAGFEGNRLNKLYREMMSEEQIISALKPILNDYAQNRNKHEKFGDFVIRKDYVKATLQGKDFHKDIDKAASISFSI